MTGKWTPFALEAEESAFGMTRIAKWHNEIVDRCASRETEIEAAVRWGYVDGYADGSAAAATAPRVDRAVERYREAKRLHMLQTEDKS